MTKTTPLVLTLTLAIILCPLVPGQVAAQRRYPRRISRPRPFSAAQINARFTEISNAYLRGYYSFNPTEATRLGLHEYDAALEPRSQAAIERETQRLRSTLAQLTHVNPAVLAPDSRYDYQLIASHARAQLLELGEIRTWQRDPNLYVRLAATGVDHILSRSYAPIEQRLDAVLARERQIPGLFGEARANLQSPPRLYTEMAVGQARGGVDYFARVVPQMVERAGGARLSAARRAQFEASNQETIAALSSFADWLERDLLPRSTESFAIGAENLQRQLLYDEMIETPIAQLVADGEKRLRQTQDRMRALADEATPGRGLDFALRAIEREHPVAEGLVGEARAQLDLLRAFVRTQQILTPPPSENLIVAETPAYMRATGFAALAAPGPFERVATEAYYYLTPPEPDWSAARKEEHLDFYNRYSMILLSIDEAIPGRYYQALALKRSPSGVRAVLGSRSFVDGWALYCRQMILEQGFGGNNPKLRLAQLQDTLLGYCRYLAGLRMHAQGMTFDEAVAFFIREGYQERTNAEREARRAAEDPASIAAVPGELEILRLREDWKQRAGEAYRPQEFHDKLLGYGMPPLRIVRLAMLGDATVQTDDSASEEAVFDFSVLATGAASEYAGPRAVQLLTEQKSWERAWPSIGGGRPVPEVNFETNAVVIAYQGRKPTGGYSIAINGIRRVGTTLVVRASEQSPPSGALTTQAPTSPFVAVAIQHPPAGTLARFDDNVNNPNEKRASSRPTYRPRRGYRRRPAP